MSDRLEGLVIDDLRKSYGTNAVLKGVSAEFASGEVHALLGANGAGKSTLLGCLSGATRPDAGTIRVRGVSHAEFTPREAFEAGIAIIYQHFQLIGPLSVSDNIFLGRELTTAVGTIDRRRQDAESAAVMHQLGLDIDPRLPVESLSVGQQQMVEIARAVRQQPHVLILDEPTAALGTHEVDALLALVKRLAVDHQIAVIYVTHLLGEVLEVADRATVLRDGNILWTRARSEIDLDDLIHAISPAATSAVRAVGRDFEDVVLTLDALQCGFTGPVDLEIRAGEVVGVFGLLGSGRTNLLETLAGVNAPHGGRALVDGTPVRPGSPRSAQEQGLSLVASDRNAQSLFGDLSAIENLLMPHYDGLAPFVRNRRAEMRTFQMIADRVGLVPRRPGQSAQSFSGGNAQKIAVGRWATSLGSTRCLLLDEPTQGVDIGSRHDLYALIRAYAADSAAAVLFASSDPEEIVALADRVVVLVDGQVRHIGPADLDETTLTGLAQPATTERIA